METPSKNNTKTTAQMGAWAVVASEKGDWNSRYSKTWHRQHGGVWEVDSRTVTFTRPWGRGQRRITVELDGWRGDWLATAVVKAGLAPAKSAAPMSVRLNKAYDAKIASRRGQVTIWQRTLLVEVADFCATLKRDGKTVTFHAYTPREAVAGLRKKIKAAQLRAEGKIIDRTLINKLHFCDQGVEEFCRITGIENRGTYTPDQIHAAIRAVGYESVAHFAPELKTLAQATGFDLSATPLAD